MWLRRVVVGPVASAYQDKALGEIAAGLTPLEKAELYADGKYDLARTTGEKKTSDEMIAFVIMTVLLGIVFLCFQGYEYYHAYHELNLKLSSGIFGSTFFMLTGFHGFHVFVGMLMLIFITLRLMNGHFTPKRHFGFEGAAWYWHFVDVVWLGLYFLVYWL